MSWLETILLSNDEFFIIVDTVHAIFSEVAILI